MDIEEEILKDLNKDKDLYEKEYVDELVEEEELTAKEGAFMKGYIEAENYKEDTEI
jgi:hypothetical protein